MHDIGAISAMSSDSQAMGRVGEVITRTWQTADKVYIYTWCRAKPWGEKNLSSLGYVALRLFVPRPRCFKRVMSASCVKRGGWGIRTLMSLLRGAEFCEMVICLAGEDGQHSEAGCFASVHRVRNTRFLLALSQRALANVARYPAHLDPHPPT